MKGLEICRFRLWGVCVSLLSRYSGLALSQFWKFTVLGVKVEKLWFFGVLDFEYSRLWALGLLLFAFENLPGIWGFVVKGFEILGWKLWKWFERLWGSGGWDFEGLQVWGVWGWGDFRFAGSGLWGFCVISDLQTLIVGFESSLKVWAFGFQLMD